ncbi:unnamed protein product [Cuscuta campestris]|uniref:Uncharacterized protein n=1 Tax=Cuscuta campestris TaxID=132261 RepID=A0A484MMZ2_9ASTE|nr:unnamed protein product [Cuscuta campestris]
MGATERAGVKIPRWNIPYQVRLMSMIVLDKLKPELCVGFFGYQLLKLDWPMIRVSWCHPKTSPSLLLSGRTTEDTLAGSWFPYEDAKIPHVSVPRTTLRYILP